MADVIWQIERYGRFIREVNERGRLRVADETIRPARVSHLFVKDSSKGRGLGRALLRFALNEFGEITGGAVPWSTRMSKPADPDWLKGWYERLGAEWKDDRRVEWVLKLENWNG